MRCLLDKVTARRILEGLLKLTEGRALTETELFALDFFQRGTDRTVQLFIVPATERVLQRLENLPRYALVIQHFHDQVEVVYPSRYFKRWLRRLRGYGFTKEDAEVLALGTFGTTKDAKFLSLHFVATFDQPMIQQWTVQQRLIREHLHAMQENLSAPYRNALLPQVGRPQDVDPGES